MSKIVSSFIALLVQPALLVLNYEFWLLLFADGTEDKDVVAEVFTEILLIEHLNRVLDSSAQ
ncbi:MAG TPA: hypothetical protein VM821_05750 [Abditibacteriaceae bacterium]|nr:hypothetical protein [Abditibacteriaceae bacterium]